MKTIVSLMLLAGTSNAVAQTQTPHWLNKTEYPFHNNFFSFESANMHFLDEGTGEILLFVHGTPSWSFDFRNVIKSLRSEFRCVAIDHIGFGLSDKPENFDYRVQHQSAAFEAFVLDKDLRDITLVLHDFGGPIGFDFAIKHPERIKQIVVLNSWLWNSEADPEFKKMKRILQSPLLPFLYRRLNFSPRFVMPASFGKEKLAPALKKQYCKPFSSPAQRNGALGFARSLLHEQAWFQELWEKRGVLNEKPILFIWGMADPVVKPHNLEKFENGFPTAKTVRLEHAGHFPQEEQPEEVAKAIRLFVRD